MVMGSDKPFFFFSKPHDLSPRPSRRLPEPMFSAIVAKLLYEIALDLGWRGSDCHNPNGVGVSSASFVRGAPSDQR